ncbi:hypothetical protein GTQ43_40160 [Nostoc sp. KVJ3]|uniref:hypothetical protein n=1 Tax=Nostoc sp. KVJ3 TaxID=457945 RepID=UPI00223752AF|nr:hypothetical protein [Nostoc sp. KVJ3]MCW5318473.1 hypothetical protein [Nostoc sp. KVJ3]MCW5319542.1 hypothetical protein [Nostoc sp. KVJ3]
MKSRQQKSGEPKKNIAVSIQKIVAKVFGFLREVLKLIWLIAENSMRLITFAFSLIVKLLANPTAPCIVAIIAFVAVCAVATAQWAAIGIWLGKLFGISGLWNIGTATCGILLGLGINIYQLSPELWKIRQDISRAYLALGIDVESSERFDNPEERLENWLTLDHGMLKSTRLISYAIETALVLCYAFLATGLNFYALIMAAISLLLPEKCLLLVSSTISVLGQVSDKMGDSEPETDHVNFT